MNQFLFSALAESNRFHMVELLQKGPRPVNEISQQLKLNQPQTSKHLRILADAGLVEVEPVAQQRIYKISPKRFKELDTWISSYRILWEERFDRLDMLLKEEKKSLKKGGIKNESR